jgi:hypothetical protein
VREQVRLGPSRELEVASAVPRARRGLFVECVEQLAGVFTDRFEHKQASPAARARRAHEQVLSCEAFECVEVCVGDCLGVLQRRAAGEHGEAGECRLLGAVEQAIAPVDRGAQCSLACGGVAWPAGERRERLVQTSSE